MSGNQVELDHELERIAMAIDRSSVVPVSVQLRGALEFGIASGELPVEARLPSVRALASRLGISPVTVSSVYAALQSGGHIEGRIGSGTFVCGLKKPPDLARFRLLEERIADLVKIASDCGLTPAELALRIGQRPSPARFRPVHILMVANFQDVTEAYVKDIRPHLAVGDTIRATTVSAIRDGFSDLVNLVIAPRTILVEVRAFFPNVEIIALSLIPDEATRIALASVPAEARVVAYSYFPTFITSLKAGVMRFAPHVSRLKMVVRGEAAAESLIAESDVLIYASGAEYLRDMLRPDQTAFEYRHTPDVHSIRNDVLPAIEACRNRCRELKEAEH